MLKKKIEMSADFLRHELPWFRCPVCHQNFQSVVQNQLICKEKHHYDLSRKGTVYFLTHSIASAYDQEMLLHRRNMIRTGLYQEMITKTVTRLKQFQKKEYPRLIDVGCGEGSFLKMVETAGIFGKKVGFDLSKDGIEMATMQDTSAFWCVADLTDLPFQNQSTDIVLNIFSPSSYQEFHRVLKKDGYVVKIVPESDYLQELRAIFYASRQDRQNYSNEKVVQNFSKHLDLVYQERMTYSFPVTREHQSDLLKMSPLHWGASEEAKLAASLELIPEITVDVEMMIGQRKQ